MFAFAIAVFFMIISPGPGVLSTAAIGAAFGFRAGARYIIGLFLGNSLVALCVILGVAALVLANPYLRYILFALSTAYILYLAKRVAFAGVDVGFHAADKKPGILDGVILQIFNPKAYVVNSTFFAGFVIWPDSYAVEVVTKFIVFNLVWFPIHFAWLWVGTKLRELNLSPDTQRNVNLAMALSLVFVVAIAAWSSFQNGI